MPVVIRICCCKLLRASPQCALLPTNCWTAWRRTAALLDQGTNESNHSRVIDTAREKLSNPDLTPSGRIVREMKEHDMPFWRLALNYSQQWQADFLNRPLSDIARAELETAASVSRHQQQELEAKSQPAFADYLQRFYRPIHRSGIKNPGSAGVSARHCDAFTRQPEPQLSQSAQPQR